MSTVIVVMGVSGSGKTTIGRALAQRLGAEFIEGDELHPQENVRKMARGVPLGDEDRWGWLAGIRDAMARLLEADRPGVVACSALKRRYRDVLREAGPGVAFAYLRAERGVIRDRVEDRADSHFMPKSLVPSQFEALEEPGPDEGDALTLEIDRLAPDAIVGALLACFRLGEGGEPWTSGPGGADHRHPPE